MRKKILVLLTIGLVLIGGCFITFYSTKEETETTSTVEQLESKPVIYDVIFDGKNWNVVNRRKVQTGLKFSREEVGTVADFGTLATLLIENGNYHIYFK